jgi:uncharacterized protein (TIGR00725 family)
MNVTVFGGSQSKEGDASYTEAYELGKLLALAGHTVLTGGYIGSMEAVSRGANEGGGYVIGVTCDEIENWRNVKANAWVQEERRFTTLQERLNELVLACEAAIALPGGPGTLTEIALSWNLMIVHSMPVKPLILLGASWKTVFDHFFKEFDSYMPVNKHKYIQFAPDIQSAMALLQTRND